MVVETDRDGYAVGAAERAGHGREAMGEALPYVVDLPDPSVDRQAVASLLLVPDVASSVYERQALVGYAVVTPLVNLWATIGTDRSTRPRRRRPGSVAPQASSCSRPSSRPSTPIGTRWWSGGRTVESSTWRGPGTVRGSRPSTGRPP